MVWIFPHFTSIPLSGSFIEAIAGELHAEQYPTIIDPTETAKAAKTCVLVRGDLNSPSAKLSGHSCARSMWVSMWKMPEGILMVDVFPKRD